MTRHAALSPSRTKDFKQCPLLFRFRSVDRLPEEPSTAALRGTLVHSVLEHLYDVPPAQRTVEYAVSQVLPAWHKHLEKDPEAEKLFAGPEELQNWLESAQTLVSNYFQMENPQFLQPRGRELFVNATLPSGLAIRGIIDRLDEAPSGALRVVDYKTGKSPHVRYQAEALFQMRFYATALVYSGAGLPARTQIIYLRDGRTLTYDPTPLDVTEIEQDLDSTWEQIDRKLDTGNFEPKTSRLCDWCYFKSICPAFGGQAPAMSESGAQYLRTAHRPRENAATDAQSSQAPAASPVPQDPGTPGAAPTQKTPDTNPASSAVQAQTDSGAKTDPNE
ncbi:putative RecB family exonuclease [Actinobaculum suis]|uniref:PD-(D/E)XK nuclease family protein n=1 Tax=Actinobaculum suis TaxID=1657 RepID=A0A1G7BVM0_9ACTO|nr:PD-(D/E)XK nuclease family protein [Actinobaculum suis]MDY5153062.1 PD-(D/E)XK nuclease family protein [Actinobaculum suis]SDE31148.1 putative RecB family exonuclease [Actinobaculum suis]